MKFEVINNEGAICMHCEHISCIPSRELIEQMSKAGYKFRIDGKVASKKKIEEVRSTKCR